MINKLCIAQTQAATEINKAINKQYISQNVRIQNSKIICQNLWFS